MSLITRRYSKCQRRTLQQRIFRKVWTGYIHDLDLRSRKIRHSLNRIFGGIFFMDKRWLKLIKSSVYIPDMEIVLATTSKNYNQRLLALIISTIAQLNSLFVFRNSIITLSKVYARRTSDKTTT